MPATATRTRTARPVTALGHSIEEACELIGRPGKPLSRQTLLAEALRGRIEILQTNRGFVVPFEAVEQYKRQKQG